MLQLTRHALRALVLLAVSGLLLHVRAAEPTVPYVPTPQEVVDRMLAMAKVTAQDYLIDLGSGDGRIVVTAAKKYGARGFGVDLNPVAVELAEVSLWLNAIYGQPDQALDGKPLAPRPALSV